MASKVSTNVRKELPIVIGNLPLEGRKIPLILTVKMREEITRMFEESLRFKKEGEKILQRACTCW